MRRLTCIRCDRAVRVHEEPVEYIDPALFVCGECLEPTGRFRPYDPAIADVGF